MQTLPTYESVLSLITKLNEAQAARYAELADSQAKTQTELRDLAATVKSVGKQLGGMAANQGDVAEELFYNSLRENPVIGGIHYDRVQANTLAGKKNKQKEFDIILINHANVALIEVKYKAHLEDVEQAEAQVAAYRSFFPEHEHFAIYSGLAAMSVPPDVAEEAHKRGLFVLKQVGDVMEVDSHAMRAF